ncbi:putative GPI-anchored protein pfl2 isoform X2 [Folsomia candida]|uniref:putative GPI-anchored protein pfl2 isoform X2 n=1 Tax=Folsomia candida TaxID=158441 RepID=UPI000B90708B|nr:putative GPI-anchored protein pfl2 isoform X2 [Folsomia candida]
MKGSNVRGQQAHNQNGRWQAIPGSGEWFLVQRTGKIAFRLNPNCLIIVGSESCDINIQSPSVDKRHAVLCFDPNADSFSLKDLNTTNGTFLNNRRISSDRPETLNNMDLLRFGFDSNVYEVRLGTAAAGPEIQQNDQNVTYFPASTTPQSRPSSSGGEIGLGGGGGAPHVMQQSGGGGGRGNSLYGSRVSSPSLTLDSGRGSSSAPSSPAKEMSPVPPGSSHLYSPNLSRKMTKSSSAEPTPNRLLLTSRNNSREQLASPLVRKDSLENEIDGLISTNKAAFHHQNKDCSNKSAVIGDLDDLNVPNEVFDEKLEPKEEVPLAMSVSKPAGNSPRPQSLCSSIDTAHSAPESSHSISAPTTSTPTPLYGTPHWWPQPKEDDDDNFSPSSDNNKQLVDDSTSNDDGQSDYRAQSLVGADAGPLSINSESNMSVDSDASDKKKISPMAFTVDFDDGPKRFGISDSISKFAPKHRRNISLTKSEDIASRRTSDTPALASKKEPSSLTLNSSLFNNNNKSVIESDIDLTEKQNVVSKCCSSRFIKGKVVPPPAKIAPVATTSALDNNNKIITREIDSSAAKKPESETPVSKMNKPKLSSGSLFSRLTKSSPPQADQKCVEGSSELLLHPVKKTMKFQSKMDTISPPSSAQAARNTTTVTTHVEKTSGSPSSKVKDADKDVDDASSETGTYTVEKEEPAVERARKSIAKMLGVPSESDISSGIRGGSAVVEEDGNSAAPEWIHEWAEKAAILHKKNKDFNPLSDTQLLLQETETVVSAMQARVTRHLSNGSPQHNSDSDDEATVSHNSPPKLMNRFKRPTTLAARNNTVANSSPMRLPREASVLSDSGYQVGYQSDSSNDGVREFGTTKNIDGAKMNRAFNIRRGRIGYDSDGCAVAPLNRQSLAVSGPTRGISPRPSGSVCSSSGIAPSATFSRNDGGRFSLRMIKSRTTPTTTQMPPPIAAPNRTTPKPSGISVGNRCASSGGRIDPNTKRRQSLHTPTASSSTHLSSSNSTANNNNFNPRKPPTGSRSNSTLTAKEVEMANWRRRKSYDPLKAAAEARKKRGTSSALETTLDDISPTSISHQSAAFLSKSMSFHSEHQFPIKCPSEEEDMIYVVDEIDSSHSNSPIHIPMSRSSHEDGHYYGMSSSHSSIRPKSNKLEALDNLVIATIHSLSNKVRTSSRHLLEKLQMQHIDNENGALLEEMVNQLKELELSSTNSSPNKSPSRELSGTLKNLKKLEQVILVLDRVLCDDSGSDANN